MKKVILVCLLLGSCMAGSGDFQSSGLLVRLLGLLESVGVGSVVTSSIETLTLSGYLKDENGNPIANATMGVEDTSSASIKQTLTTSTRTDSDGRYTLTLKVGSFTIRVTDSSGNSLGTFFVQASSTTTDPVISVSAGSFVITVSALNNGATSSPSALSYSGSPYTFTKDNPIPTKTPTYSGNITSCKSTPTLPTGLSLSSTCEISGNPTIVQNATSYHIVGSNSFGNTSTIIVITVNQLAPSSFGYFNNVVSLTQNIPMASLQTYYTGTITSCSSAPPLPAGLQIDPSSCIVYGTPTSTQSSTSHTITASNSVGSTTANLIITVNLKPPSSLSYSGSPFTFTSGLPISSRIPTYSNSISTCSANPSLPSGLSLSSVCTITGTPSSVQVARSYTITASNSGGSTQTSLVITINPQAPASLSYSGSPFTFTRNVAITTRTPTVTGTIPNCTISPALPTGLGINSTNCAISGTPTVTQTATTHTITASNLGGSTTTSITITVNLAAPTSLSYAGSPFIFTQNVAISSQTPSITGTISTCTISPNLPSGLGINGTTCVLSGTPTVVQTPSNYTITASNSGGSTTATISIAVNIAPPSSLSYSGSPYTFTQNTAISARTPTFNGSVNSCTTNPALPTGLGINGTTCVISGTPTVVQTATNYTVTATNSSGSTTASISITVNMAPPSSLSYSGSPYTFTQNTTIAAQTPTFTGSVNSCTISPALPTGLGINGTTCVISGTPTVLQSATNYTVTATNPSGSITASISIIINVAPPSSLSYTSSPFTFTQNTAISAQTPTFTGSVSSCTTNPTLPTGLGINGTTCVISGTPTVVQTATNYTVTATNPSGSTTTSISIIINVTPPSSLSYISSPFTFTQNTAISAQTSTFTGSVSSCTTNPTLPTGLGINGTTCAISGTPTVIQSATNYTVTATNSSGSTTATISITVNIAPPSSLSYSGSPFTFTQNTAISARTPTFTGSVTSCTTSPTLPTGLGINGTTCVISGTPTVIQSATNYTVTATNSSGSTTATISITVNIAPPSSLSYSGSPYTFTQNVAIALQTPTFSGSVTSCTTSLPLPPGLGINGTTCAISGTPTVVQSATYYTVIATNSSGSTTTSIIITVNIAPPSSLSYSSWNYTLTQNIAISGKGPRFSGTVTSCTSSPALPTGLGINGTTCEITGTPTVLQSAINYTIIATNFSGSTTATISIAVNIAPPSSLSYSGYYFSFTQNVAIASQTPTFSGSVNSCTTNRPLPLGLGINGTTCAISGTPTVLQCCIYEYLVTATNSSGSTTALINISVIISPPSSLNYSGKSFTFTQNAAIAPQTPSFTGSVTSCTTNPQLPAGLGINGTTCIISGTPTVVQTTTNYTVTATNSSGSTTASISIAVNIAPPSSLTYSGSPFVFLQNYPVYPMLPTANGTITSCSISPNIQTETGLNFNTTNCNIIGTPTIIKSSTNYTITASNSNGSTNTTINITVSNNVPIVSTPLGLLKTGQTIIYQAGDDGFFQKGISRTFIIGGRVGLLWQRCSAGLNNDASCSGTAQSYTWSDANNYCSTLSIEGKTWRLPTISELITLIDYGKSSSPTIDTNSFPNTQTVYWSSSTNAQDFNKAWGVFFAFGSVYNYFNKSNGNIYVRCTTEP